MKKTPLLVIGLCSLLLTACHSDSTSDMSPTNTEDTQKMGTLEFQILSYDVSPLLAPQRAPRYAVPNISQLACLDMGIYDADTHALVYSDRKEKGSEDYGSFSAILPYGTYLCVFLGYSDNRRADLSSPTNILFTDNFVPNCFCKTLTVEVKAATAVAQPVVLERAIADFVLVSTGTTIPTNLHTLRITAIGGGYHLNTLTKLAPQAENRTHDFLATSEAGSSSLTVTYHSFLPAEETFMDFEVTALDKDQNVIRSRTFSNVNMKINQRTRFTGDFFAPDAFTVSLEEKEWDISEQNY